MASIVGGCVCGAVRYEAPAKVSNTMVCHCQSCRRQAGSPVVAWITVAHEGFRFTKGRPVEFHSTMPVTRTFCGACGTPLTYRHSGRATHVDITTCSLDEPDAYPPTHHSWLSDDLGWVKFGDGLPMYPGNRPG